MFSNKVYDILKWIAMPCLPAVTTLILTLGKIWGWDIAPMIGATVAAIDTFLCAILQISSYQYNNSFAEQEYVNTDLTEED